jgi:hypothetical protein
MFRTLQDRVPKEFTVVRKTGLSARAIRSWLVRA